MVNGEYFNDSPFTIHHYPYNLIKQQFFGMKKLNFTLVLAMLTLTSYAQTVLFDYHFSTSPLPAAITYTAGGALSTTKAGDVNCSTGAVTIPIGGSMSIDVASCSIFRVNMKSSASGARVVTVSYKLQSDPTFTVLTPTQSVVTGSYNFQTLYPAIVSSSPITVKIENAATGGVLQIHDLYVESSSVVSNAAEITAFALPNQIGNATINSGAGTIAVNVPLGTNLTSVTPSTLTTSTSATVSPTAATARDFTNPVTYVVTAQDGTTTKTWTVTVNTVASTLKEITAFQLSPSQIGASTINSGAGTIAVSMPFGSTLTNLVPTTLTISASATISPLASAAQNFSSPVVYTVTAQDGSMKTWTVTVTIVTSTAKEITAFQLAPSQIGSAVINSGAGTIAVNMPLGSTLTNLVPTTLTISASATISPLASAAQDFSSPVVYTVTAQDNSTKTWTVTVTLVDPNATYTDYQAEDAVFTGIVATNHLNYTGTGFIDFNTSGPNNATFTVCQQAAGSQTVKFRYSFAKPPPDIRTARLIVNDVDLQDVTFPVTATFDDWLDATAIITLNQGINTIKLYWATTDGPNLDRMSISGAQCASYTLTTATTNGGTITKNPSRTNNKYFDVESVTLTAVDAINATFSNWSGDLTGSTNPSVVAMTSNKNITANFTVVSTYTLTLNKTGIGSVSASPAATNGVYAAGTVVTLSATPLLSNSFINWTGDASGTTTPTTVTMNANKTATGNFTSNYSFNFNKVVGYASITADGFTGPTTGGQTTTQPVLCINGPADFNKLCESLYNRQRAYANKAQTAGTVSGTNMMLKQPLIILLKAGTYNASQALSSVGANAYGNDMLDIAEQGDLTFIGEGNVTLNFGINVKRSYNIIIRNISLHSYGDDGVNIGYPETHHIWVDHCTFGHPTTYPTNSEIPDGTAEVKGGSSYVTISWCKFQNHHKTCLLGHSDNNGAEDRGRLKTTYFANYFFSTNSRHPRTRFGTVHVLNNMYENVGRGRQGGFGYGIGASNESQVWVEGNFFLDTRWPMSADRSTADFAAVYGPLQSQNSNIACFGLKSLNNEYDDSGLTATIVGQVKAEMINPSGMSVKFDELTGPNFTYVPSNDYNYSADLLPAQAVRVLIPQYAGADNPNINWGVNCTTIPLNLLDFAATKQNNEAVLTWKTVNEQNVSLYEVERSNDGKAFYAVGQTKANNTLDVQTYTLTDKMPLVQIQYYRLKMVDYDGTTTYSKIVSLSKEGLSKFKIYPSVTKDILTVETTTSGASTINIVDVLGRIVSSRQIAASENTMTTEISVSNLPIGVYSVVFESANGRSAAKFIKQ